jgi:aldose 1-epimerase
VSTAAVDEGRFRGAAAITVRAGALAATFLPDLGMTGVSLRREGREHLALPGGLAALRAGATLGLPLLAPWANRLSSRRYRAAGTDVDLSGIALRTDDNGLPIHGVLVGRPGWTVTRRSARAGIARLSASTDVDSPAFPFPHRIEIAVAARDDRLSVDTTITPTGRIRVPVAFGWHPYLRLPGPRAGWLLRLPARTHLALDERGIPTGASTTESPEAETITGRTFDDLYRLGRDRCMGIATGDGGPAITVRLETGYPYAQVWVPSGRRFVALEPMTSPTNSLVDGTAPLVEPGGSHRTRFSLVLDDES